MVECFERVWTHWERFLVTILEQLQHSRFSSVSMCMEVVFFYIFPVNKEIFTLITFIFSIFECLHLMCLVILVSLRGWNYIFHNYDTKGPRVEIGVLLKYIINNFCYFVYFSPTYNLKPLGFWFNALRGCKLLKNVSLLPFQHNCSIQGFIRFHVHRGCVVLHLPCH